MKKTLKVKLTPTKEQAKSLLETIETFNDACNWISRKSFETGTPYDPEEFLGVDMGIVHLSTDSDGESFSGEGVDQVRKKIHTLKKASGKETRFKKDTNHCLSKRIGSKAKGTGRCIALEDLKGFNGRTMVGKSQKERFGKWAFDQPSRFIT